MHYTICFCFVCFFFNDTATTEIYTLSLHDALPICVLTLTSTVPVLGGEASKNDASLIEQLQRSMDEVGLCRHSYVIGIGDRKSTRLNSSHRCISYAVFCLKKKKKITKKNLKDMILIQ